MNNCITLEYKIEDNNIENPLLPKCEIELYDLNECFKKVEKKINDYIKAQCYYPNIKKPTITYNYEIRYECFVPKKVDKVANYVQVKISEEEKIQELYSSISSALEGLSKDEFTYFLDCLYYKRSENYLIDKIQTTRFLFNQLKASCIIKLANALDVAILKPE